MTVLADILISILLIAAGYVAVCYYFHEKRWNSKDTSSLKVNKNKIMYLSLAICVAAVLIIIFQLVYDLDILTQMKLISLVLILFPIAAVDYRTQRIPNPFIIAALAIRFSLYIPEVIVSPSGTLAVLLDNLLGAFVISIFFLLLLLFFKNSIGMGDIKLFFVMGMFQGLWGVVNSVFFSLLVSFVASVTLLITRKKKRTDTISFGPSILLGTIIAICLAGM